MIDKLTALLASTEVEELTLTVRLKGAASHVPVDPGTPGQPPPVHVPDPPHVVGLAANKTGPGSVKLTWSNAMKYSHIYINVYKDGGKPTQTWIDGDATETTFNDLSPGHYRFEVICIVPDWHGLPEAYGYFGVDVNV